MSILGNDINWSHVIGLNTDFFLRNKFAFPFEKWFDYKMEAIIRLNGSIML